MASFNYEQSLADIEREHILKVVALCDGNRTHAAKLLDISIRGLRIKLRRYALAGVQVPPAHSNTDGRYSFRLPNLGSLPLDG